MKETMQVFNDGVVDSTRPLLEAKEKELGMNPDMAAEKQREVISHLKAAMQKSVLKKSDIRKISDVMAKQVEVREAVNPNQELAQYKSEVHWYVMQALGTADIGQAKLLNVIQDRSMTLDEAADKAKLKGLTNVREFQDGAQYQGMTQSDFIADQKRLLAQGIKQMKETPHVSGQVVSTTVSRDVNGYTIVNKMNRLDYLDKKRSKRYLVSTHSVEIYDQIDTITDIKDSGEYFEYVKQLQLLTKFPDMLGTTSSIPTDNFWTKSKKDGKVYLASKLKSNSQWRKVEMGVCLPKEKDRNNLALSTIDVNNNFVRAVEPDGGRYVLTDGEAAIMLMDGIYKQHFASVASLGTHTIYNTVFTMHEAVAQKILNVAGWLSSAKHKGLDNYTVGANNGYIMLNYTKVNNLNKKLGVGSGIGTTKTVSTVTTEAIPSKHKVDATVDPDGYIAHSIHKSQTKETTYTTDFVDKEVYGCFQVAAVGNQQNIVWISTVDGNNKLNGPMKLFSVFSV
jgi:hypothetical protein